MFFMTWGIGSEVLGHAVNGFMFFMTWVIGSEGCDKANLFLFLCDNYYCIIKNMGIYYLVSWYYMYIHVYTISFK